MSRLLRGLSQFVGEDFNHSSLWLRFKGQDYPRKQGVGRRGEIGAMEKNTLLHVGSEVYVIIVVLNYCHMPCVPAFSITLLPITAAVTICPIIFVPLSQLFSSPSCCFVPDLGLFPWQLAMHRFSKDTGFFISPFSNQQIAEHASE